MRPSFVVLTDFFAVSNRALAYAAGLAVPLQAHLVLLHLRHDALLNPPEYRNRPSRENEQKTVHVLEHLAATQPVPAEVEVSEDFLPDAVQEVVRRHHPLLLVLGRPGSATAPIEIITSTAMDLLRHAQYPLLVVPTVGWDVAAPKRLLLAVDGEPFRLGPHPGVVRRLLKATKATLDVVYVTSDGSGFDTPDVLENIQQNDLLDEPLDPQCLHQVYAPEPVAGVLETAANFGADMLVVVARRHSLLGSLFHRSVTAQLLQESPIPVLLLPAED